LKAFS